jgi:rfaE bifunctional protein kinase chain/domain
MRLADLSAARLLIVGDVMLDRYWFGDVTRISPEAPVPIVKIERSEERPGGAANVARNVAALGASRSACSRSSATTKPGGACCACWKRAVIAVNLHVDPAISTTVKLRVIGRQQQLLRIDFETSPSHEVLRAKLLEFASRLGDCDAVILSDYGKGGLTHIGEMIRLARDAGKHGAGRPQGRRFFEVCRRYRRYTQPRGAARVVGRWHDDEELARKAEALRAPPRP